MDIPDWTTALLLAACVVSTLAVIAALARWVASTSTSSDQTSALTARTFMTWVAEVFVGLSFGCGLVISGMARPSKVVAFLDLGSGSWDLSLGFVMGGALMLTFPFFQVAHFRGMEKAVLGSALEWPARKAPVDRSLVAGALLFGVGWGTCGMCPGPVWVALGAMPSVEVGVAFLGMLTGTLMTLWAQKNFAASDQKGQAAEIVQGVDAGEGTTTETSTPAEQEANHNIQGKTKIDTVV